jgi:RNA polymerase sigma-70 factor (ECF subfamily)
MDSLDPGTRGRFQNGDLQALGQIVERFQASLYRMGLRLFRQPADALDFTQDVCLRAYEKRARYDSSRPFEPWFYKLALNLAREKFRRRRELPAGDELPEPSHWGRAHEVLEVEERDRLVGTALQRVRPKYREVLALRFSEEHPLHEIAQVLGISLGTVKSRLSRGLKAFHQAYLAVGGEEHALP